MYAVVAHEVMLLLKSTLSWGGAFCASPFRFMGNARGNRLFLRYILAEIIAWKA